MTILVNLDKLSNSSILNIGYFQYVPHKITQYYSTCALYLYCVFDCEDFIVCHFLQSCPSFLVFVSHSPFIVCARLLLQLNCLQETTYNSVNISHSLSHIVCPRLLLQLDCLQETTYNSVNISHSLSHIVCPRLLLQLNCLQETTYNSLNISHSLSETAAPTELPTRNNIQFLKYLT